MANARGTINGHLIYRWLVHIVKADKERFIARLSASIVLDGDCRLFMTEGGKTRKGYRRMSAGIDGRLVKFYTHHVFWTLANKRPIAIGMEIDHICCNSACINPAHLREVTPLENTRYRNHG